MIVTDLPEGSPLHHIVLMADVRYAKTMEKLQGVCERINLRKVTRIQKKELQSAILRRTRYLHTERMKFMRKALLRFGLAVDPNTTIVVHRSRT